MSNHRRIATLCGLVSPTVVLGSILLATVLAAPETFTWADRALSDMGRPGAETFPLFNGALIVGGALGFPFVLRLHETARNRLERLGAGLFGLALVALAGVGIFFLEHTRYYLDVELHAPVALSFFGLAPLSLGFLGAGAVAAGDRRWGVATCLTGAAQVLVWLGYALFSARVATEPGRWFAVPELLVALAFGAWTAAAAWRLLDAADSTRNGREDRRLE